MKKLIALFACLLISASASFGVIDYTYRDIIKDIQNGAETQNAIVDLYVDDDANINGDLFVNDIQIPKIVVDTNTSTTVTGYTPDAKGQLLVGATGGTNEVWIAGGTTTNDWVLITD